MLGPSAALRKPFHAHPEVRTIGVLALVAGVLAVWHAQAAKAGKSTLVEEGIRAGLTPVQAAFTRATEASAQAFGAVASAWSLAREKRELEDECARLQADNQRLKALYFDESERIGEQLGLPDESPVEGAPAVVIAGSGEGYDARIRIRVASGYDLREGDAACTAAGLVGAVESVDGSTGWVRLLTHPDSHVAAMIQRTGDLGIIHGPAPDAAGDALRMEYLYQGADVRVGDKVLTSGRGEIYPKRLYIGTVKAVVSSATSDVSLAALVEPAADLRRVAYVRLVRRPE